MDTREKILAPGSISKLLETGVWTVVIGLFDPLTAVQARRIAALRTAGRKLLAIVIDRPDTLLTVEARSALIAALRDVDAVVSSQVDSWRPLIPPRGTIELIEDSEAEQIRSSEFIAFVLARQAGALAGKA